MKFLIYSVIFLFTLASGISQNSKNRPAPNTLYFLTHSTEIVEELMELTPSKRSEYINTNLAKYESHWRKIPRGQAKWLKDINIPEVVSLTKLL